MSIGTTMVESYFPEPGDLNPAYLQAQRDYLEAFLRARFPDLDMRPNTPFGDLFLSPAATLKTALEHAVVSMLEDTDLDNLEAGIVHNEDMARSFLSSFGDFSRKSIGNYGFIRISFSENAYASIPGHTRFKLGSDTAENEFSIVRSYQGDVRFYPAGQDMPAGTNSYPLVQDGTNRYSALVPVQGITPSDIEEGVPAYSTPEIEGAVALYGAGRISATIVPESVPEMARLARNTLYDASFSSKRSAESFALTKIPELLAVSSASTGDYEMRRPSTNIAGLTSPCLDLYVRSRHLFEKSALVKAYWDADAERFYAKLPFAGPLDHLVSVTYPENGAVVFDHGLNDLMASSIRPGVPMAGNGVQGREVLFVSAAMPVDVYGDALVELDVDGAGRPYADLLVTVAYDPAVEVVQALAYGDDDAPAGVSLDIRPFVSVVVDRMEISYRKLSTMSPSLEDAEEYITEAMHRFNHRRPYSAAAIENLMLAAGATEVVGIEFDTHVEFSAATRYLVPGISALPATYAGLVAGSVVPGEVARISVENPKPFNVYQAASSAVLGDRNYCYSVRTGSIKFTEVL